MAKTKQTVIRLTEEAYSQAQELSLIWGRIRPLSIAAVFMECVRIVHYQEMQIMQKTQKKTSRNSRNGY